MKNKNTKQNRWLNKKFKTIKEARKYAKKIGGRRIIFTTEKENY